MSRKEYMKKWRRKDNLLRQFLYESDKDEDFFEKTFEVEKNDTSKQKPCHIEDSSTQLGSLNCSNHLNQLESLSQLDSSVRFDLSNQLDSSS